MNRLDVLAQNRDAILLAEVGAWLHMLGKYDKEFIRNSGKQYQDFCNRLVDGDRLKSLLTDGWPQTIWKLIERAGLKNPTKSLGEFILGHTDRKTKTDLLRILVDAHGRGSGTKKGILTHNAYDNQGEKQCYKKVHLSSPFGYESEPIDLTVLSEREHLLHKFLENQLLILKESLDSNARWSLDKWKEWYNVFIERLNIDFGTTVGDTRRPINDVTLWDQTSATVAFFKTELAEILLTKWRDPLDEKNQFKYRVLRVAFDADSFVAQSQRIGDVLARRQLVEDAFDEVKHLIEVEYPLGLEIYRDTNRIVFLAPDVVDLLNCADGQNKTLYQLIEDKFNGVFNGEAKVEIALSPKGSRNVFFTGRESARPIRTLSPTPNFLKEAWKVVSDRCSTCQIRPQGSGAELVRDYSGDIERYSQEAHSRKMCCVCMARLKGRSREWATGRLSETVWIDEVADASGRVVLIAGRFDLGEWLNGELISTFRNPRDDCGTRFSEIGDELSGALDKELEKLAKFMMIADREVTKRVANIAGLSKLLVQDEDLGEGEFLAIPLSERRALAIWRKPPSFDRVRRIWESTQDFWKKSVERELRHIIGVIGPRLVITGNLSKPAGDYRAYGAELEKGIRTNVVYDRERERFINASNLLYLAERLGLRNDKEELTYERATQEIKNLIEVKGSLTLYEDPAQTGRQVEFATITQCKVTIEQHNFLPAIPILADPVLFMALVPADKALNLLKHIRGEYEVQFSKVRNRLALNLNMVFFDRKQPLYAALDCARRMLARKSPYDALWEVQSTIESSTKETCDNSGRRLADHHRRVVLERTSNASLSQTCELLLSYGTGDPSKEDVWHPYFFAETKASEGQELSERNLHFRAPFPNGNSYCMKDMVHLKDLVKGDRVYYSPSTLDFEFLDITTRRYELVYENEMRLPRPMESWATRAFLLEDSAIMDRLWNVLSTLSSAQLQQLAGLLEGWRELWQVMRPGDPTYDAFAVHALQRAFDKQWVALPETDKNVLTKWAADGRLLDLLELYMKIMKLKTKGDTET